MKHTTHTLFIALATILLSLAACQDGNDFGDGYTPSLEKSAKTVPTKDNISISPTSLPDFISDGEEKSVTVTANNSWSMVLQYNGSTTGWLTISPNQTTFGAGTQTISITASKNTTTVSRSATITFSCGTAAPVTLNVSQLSPGKHTSATSGEGFPAVKDGVYTLDNPDASTLTIDVTSNEGWTATSSNAAMCTLQPSNGSNNGKVNVTVTKNTTVNDRTATLTIKGNDSGDETTITVKQPGIKLSVLPTSLDFDAARNSKELTVTSNTSEWTVESSDNSWCTATKSGNAITVTVTENTSTSSGREAVIRVMAGELTPIEVKVNQKKKEIAPFTEVTSSTDITFNKPDEQTVDISIRSNEDWTATLSANATSWGWTVTSDKEKGIATVTIAKNTTANDHSATLTIKGNDSGDETTITVKQSGIKLSVLPTSLDFDAARNSKELTVTSNTSEWTVESSDNSWCTVKKTGDNVLEVAVIANNTASQRNATVTITAGEVSIPVQIKQNRSSSITIDPFGDDENWD